MVALSTASAALAQTDEEPTVIDHADVLTRSEEGDSLTYTLLGAVRAHRGGVRMRSQEAKIYRNSGVADFQRNVRFWDREKEIYADRVVYEEEANTALATGNVQLVDRESGSQVLADTVHYDRDADLIIAWPRPHGLLYSADTAGQSEPFDLYADEMRFQGDSIRPTVVAVRNVLIERTDLTAVGDSLMYDEVGETVALRIRPRVETEETFLTAETIDIHMTDSEIESLVALGQARAVDKTDSIPAPVPFAFQRISDTSYLEGDSLYISFSDDGIEWLVAEGRARSFNYQRESAQGVIETWSVNYLIGHRLRLTFRGDTLDQVVASGGHRGLYRSEEVRIGGVERRPSEAIPLPDLSMVREGVLPERRRRRAS